jgi:hypothetical protein
MEQPKQASVLVQSVSGPIVISVRTNEGEERYVISPATAQSLASDLKDAVWDFVFNSRTA